MNKKRALLFDSINLPIVVFCYFLKPFFSKIFFRYSKKKIIIPIYPDFFVKIGYSKIDGSLFNKSFLLKKFLIKKYLKNVFIKTFFTNFCEFIGLDKKKKNKLIFSFENILYNNEILSIDTSSYIYSEKFLKDFSIIYLPDSIKSYLLLNQIKKKNFKIISLYAYLNIVRKFSILIINMIISFPNKIKKKFSNNNKNPTQIYNGNQIGYFPHKNLKYGSFFSKTFFYKNEKDSLIYKLGIDTIFFEKTDKVSERYLRIFKKPQIILKGKISKNFLIYFFKYLVFIVKNIKFIRFNKITLLFFFLIFYLKIEKFNNVLRERNYRFFFFYNDYLVPNTLLISAAINQIKTISFQDRLTSYVYNNRIICDCYFTCGNYFNKIFNKKYFYEKLIPIGLLRSNLIDRNLIKDDKFLYKIDTLKKNKKIVSFILITTGNNNRNYLYGESGTSIHSLNAIEKLILRLANKLDNRIHILIKFKDSNFKNEEKFFNFENRLSKFNNVEIVKNESINSANIISISDIVIGSQSTIIEESLIKNKYTFIFDSENFASTIGFYRYNNFYILKSTDKAINSALLILNEDKTYIDDYNKNKKFFVKNYLSENGRINNFQSLKNKITEYMNDELKN